MADSYYNNSNKKANGNADNNSTKLNFTDGAEDNSLFFEHEQQSKKKEQNKQKNFQQPSLDKEEFSLPPKYTINKRYNTSRMIVDESPKVHTTYMPKFTEASQNYRITEEKRPRRKFDPDKLKAKNKKDENVDAKETIDPTTEAVEQNNNVDVNVINTAVPTPAPKQEPTHSTVYKFEKPVVSKENEASIEEPPAEVEETSQEFVIVSDESSADSVFGSGEIDCSVMLNKSETVFKLNNDYASFENLAETSAEESESEETILCEETSNDEKNSEQKEEEPANENILPDPEPIVIDVPTPGENPVVERGTYGMYADAPETVGDESFSVGKTSAVEYTAFSQRDSFKDKFLDTIMSVKVRLFASIAIMIVAFLIENLFLFGVSVPSLVGMFGINSALAILDIQVVVALFLLALPEIISAFHRMLLGRATPEIFVPVSFIFLIIYYILIIFYSPAKYPLFGLVFAIFTISAILASLFKKSADFSNFKTVSRNSSKKIVDRKLTRTLPEESFAVDGRTEIYKSKTARVFRAAFIADFFKRSGKCSENSSNVMLVLVSTFGVSFVAGVVAFFVSNGLISAIETFITVFMLGIPTFTVLTHKLPYYHSSVEAMYENSAVIGESTLYDYSGVDVITFQDTEVFGAEDINLQRIMLYGKNENLPKAMQQMTALFTVVGGPLENMFAASIEQYTAYATNVAIEDDGVFGEVLGNEVRAGSYEYMRRHGIAVPDAQQKENPYNSVKVMYAAENGEVYAKFYIRYSLSEEFAALLPMMGDEGIVPLIYTRDPNVNGDLLRMLTAGTDMIRVLKKYNLPLGDEKVYHRVSAGLVTMGDKNNIVNMILMSKKYVRFQSRMTVTEVTAMIVGCVLALLISLGNMFAVPSAILALWQAAWCVVLFFMSKHALRTERRSRKTTKKD